MKDRRIGLVLVLLCGLGSVCGCSSTFQLFVGNDTERAFALRIDKSSHAYPLKPATKRKLPDRLLRQKAYTLVLRDREGKEYRHSILADSPRLFVHVRDDGSDGVKWLVSDTPPEE